MVKVKKFVPFSKMLSRRILIINIVMITVLAVLVISFATVGLKSMVNAYFQSGLFAAHESIENRLGRVDCDSLYRHLKRLDVGFNDFNPLFEETNEKDNKEVWAYNIVIDSLGNYIYHPDKQRIGKGNFFIDIRQTDDAVRQELTRGLAAERIGQQMIKVDGVPSTIFFLGMKDAKWANAIIMPETGLLIPHIITALILLTIIFVGLLAAYWICLVTIRRSAEPLQVLAKSADEVAKGNFQNPLPEVELNNEISQLRDSFANMQQSLTQYIEQLKATTAQQAALESELGIARNIQLSMVPTVFPDRDDISLYASMTPAKAVGGDLYDFFLVRGHEGTGVRGYEDTSAADISRAPEPPRPRTSEKLYFCIGDVSGKGVPAALFMAQAMSLFRAYSKDEDMPDRIVSQMNHDLSQNNENCMFVTLFVGILDLSSGLLRYSNAGHEPPIVIRSNDQTPSGSPYLGGEEAQLLPVEPCLPVGLNADMAYQTQEVVIEPQTTIFFYTDGLNEAMDADNKEFGDDRILDEVNHAVQVGRVAPKDLTDQMTKAVHNFVGDTEQSDDLTMLVIQYKYNSI